MKTANLKGAELDFWVAKALNLKNPRIINDYCYYNILGDAMRVGFYPSINWNSAGELITRFNLTIMKNPDKEIWGASSGMYIAQQGATPQIAICRCVVELTFGKEIT